MYNVDDNSEIKELRWSVHHTPEKTDFSLINLTYNTGSKPKHNGRHFTSVIKKPGNFSAVFYLRSNDLTGERYLFHPSKKYLPKISMGEFDPKNFQLVYGVYVGDSSINISWTRKFGIHAAHAVFAKLRILVLWTFFGCPSDSTSDWSSIDNSNKKLDDANIAAAEKKIVEMHSHGYDYYNVIENFLFMREYIRDLYFKKMFGSFTEEFQNMVRNLQETFFLRGITDTIEYKVEQNRRISICSSIDEDKWKRLSAIKDD